MGSRRFIRVFTVAVALVATAPAFAQRLSLAERVARLEQQAAADSQGSSQANLEANNRQIQLQAEVRELRGLVERLQNDNEQLRQRLRDQSADFDARLARLEGGEPVAAGAPPAAAPAAAAPAAAEAPAARPGAGVVASIANGNAAAAPADPANEQADYDRALDTLVDKFEADESARLFQAFLRNYPDSTLAPNAWYWLGESYYVTQNFELALGAFQSLVERHPGSRKEADALLKLGYCHLALGQNRAGESTLRELVARHPGTDAAAKAENRLRTLALESR